MGRGQRGDRRRVRVVTAAIFGLVGVTVGALLTGAFDLFFERRRARAAVRQATLLATSELEDAMGLLSEAAKRGRAPAILLATNIWGTYRAVLAGPAVWTTRNSGILRGAS